MRDSLLIWTVLLFSPIALAETPTKVFLTAPTEMTHHLGKFWIKPGLAYVWGTDKKAPLAIGELASDATIVGIPFRKGTTLYLKSDPERRPHDFEVACPTEETLAGVAFLAGSRIRLSVTEYKTLKRPDQVRIEGEMSRETTIDGVVYSPGRITVEALLNGPLMEKATVLEGSVESGTIPAAAPILLAKGNRIQRAGTGLTVENLSAAQEFGPQKLRGLSARFTLPSGFLVWIHLREPTRLESVELQNGVFLFPNGKPRIGYLSKEQTVAGIHAGRGETESLIDTGWIAFHPTGAAAIVTSRFVDRNAAYLPNEFSVLPSVLKPKEGVLAHFLNSRSEIVAVVLHAPQGRGDWVKTLGENRYFEAKPVSGGIDFEQIPESEKKLRSLLSASIQSGPSKETFEYLEQGKLP